MSERRWQAVKARAGDVHGTDTSKLFHALAVAYLDGQVDDVVSIFLPRISPGGDLYDGGRVPGHPAQPAAVNE